MSIPHAQILPVINTSLPTPNESLVIGLYIGGEPARPPHYRVSRCMLSTFNGVVVYVSCPHKPPGNEGVHVIDLAFPDHLVIKHVLATEYCY